MTECRYRVRHAVTGAPQGNGDVGTPSVNPLGWYSQASLVGVLCARAARKLQSHMHGSRPPL